MSDSNVSRSGIPRFLRLFCVPVLVAWLAITAVVNVVVPQLEAVGEANSTSLTPDDAPSLQATKLVGELFGENMGEGVERHRRRVAGLRRDVDDAPALGKQERHEGVAQAVRAPQVDPARTAPPRSARGVMAVQLVHHRLAGSRPAR